VARLWEINIQIIYSCCQQKEGVTVSCVMVPFGAIFTNVESVFRIRDILVRIRIRESVPH
jgi:hypothetical protein